MLWFGRFLQFDQCFPVYYSLINIIGFLQRDSVCRVPGITPAIQEVLADGRSGHVFAVQLHVIQHTVWP